MKPWVRKPTAQARMVSKLIDDNGYGWNQVKLNEILLSQILQPFEVSLLEDLLRIFGRGPWRKMDRLQSVHATGI